MQKKSLLTTLVLESSREVQNQIKITYNIILSSLEDLLYRKGLRKMVKIRIFSSVGRKKFEFIKYNQIRINAKLTIISIREQQELSKLSEKKLTRIGKVLVANINNNNCNQLQDQFFSWEFALEGILQQLYQSLKKRRVNPPEYETNLQFENLKIQPNTIIAEGLYKNDRLVWGTICMMHQNKNIRFNGEITETQW